MPIWLRNLTHNLIAETKQKETEVYSKQHTGKNKKIDFNKPQEAKQALNQANPPTYVTKASKK